jgi:hypothetical protein
MMLPSGSTLQDLSDAILHAYGSNHDHLYRFFYPNHLDLTEVALHPDLDPGPHADDVQIGEHRVVSGYQMVYNYDFVEDWLFQVVLINVSKGRVGYPRSRLGQSRGESPNQCPDTGWDAWLF